MPDGSPQSTPVWYDTEEGLIRINTAIDRVKDRNLRVRSKVALSILDPENPYSFIGIRGEVVERTTENADPHIDLLAKKYLGADTYPYIKPLSIFGLN
jgi:PPOX class probable F420-dependent enzyme